MFNAKFCQLPSVVLFAFLAIFSTKSEPATFDATAIVNFFCGEAGKTLAVLAWQDKVNGVPIGDNMHRRPVRFIDYLDNEIIRTVYRQSATQDDAEKTGFRVCVALMVNE